MCKREKGKKDDFVNDSIQLLVELSGGWAMGTLGNTGLEAVLEFAVDGLEVTHATGAGGLTALGLLAPVDYIFTKKCEFSGSNSK